VNRPGQGGDLAAARARLARDLAATAQGDRAALERVYRATSAKLFGVCVRILGEREAAEEVLQEVYLLVWRKADQFDPDRASPISWLAAIARNKAVDRLRERKEPPVRPLEEAADVQDDVPCPETAAAMSDEHARLLRCLELLGARPAALIRTAFWEGLPYERLAEREGAPLGTVKSWIRRGLLSLRACLEP